MICSEGELRDFVVKVNCEMAGFCLRMLDQLVTADHHRVRVPLSATVPVLATPHLTPPHSTHRMQRG